MMQPKVLTAILLLVFSLLQMGCDNSSRSQSNPALSTNFSPSKDVSTGVEKRLHVDDLGYSIEFPESWHAIRSQNTVLISPKTLNTLELSPQYTAIIIDSTLSNNAAEDWSSKISQSISAMQARYPNVRVVQKPCTHSAGIAACVIMSYTTDSGYDLVAEFAFVRGRGRLITMNVMGVNRAVASSRSTIDKILQSLVIE